MCWLAPGESSSGEQDMQTKLSYVAGEGRGSGSLLVDFKNLHGRILASWDEGDFKDICWLSSILDSELRNHPFVGRECAPSYPSCLFPRFFLY